jgi:hypothetical protein
VNDAPSSKRTVRTGTERERVAHARDQDASPFAIILDEMIGRVPGALAAALVDAEGETVDYAGHLPPFDVKIAAAHLRLVLSEAAQQPSVGALSALVVLAAHRSFIVCPLPDEYAMVIVLRRRAGFTASSRALYAAERALCREAGWRAPRASLGDHAPEWCPVEVECDRRHRPSSVRLPRAKCAHGVEILGSVVGLRARERGFRVRLHTGAELTLVRESGGFWYSDALFDAVDEKKL